MGSFFTIKALGFALLAIALLMAVSQILKFWKAHKAIPIWYHTYLAFMVINVFFKGIWGTTFIPLLEYLYGAILALITALVAFQLRRT